MPFIIPNATDTTSSNKYAVLDQAEPDSIDFEILGNDRTGVIGDGCEVTVAPSGGNTAVSVSAGTVALNGTIYQIASNPFLNVPTNPTSGTARFDLIVARLLNGSMTLTVLEGDQSSSNPTYPKSLSRVTGVVSGQVLKYFDPKTDVVLAALYRQTSIGTILPGHIVDKRKNLQTPIAFRGTGAPASNQGEVGDLYLRTSPVTNGESGLYVKRSSDTWAQVASTPIDPGVPVGSVITWIAPTNPNTSVWVECNGAAVGRSGAYSSLFAVLGTTYGAGDGSTSFNLPDLRGMFLAGLPATGASLGSQYGNADNLVALTADQVPGHTHDINHGHTGTTAENGIHAHGTEGGSHVHAMNHGHAVTVSSAGDHTHSSKFLQNANNTGPNHYLRPVVDQFNNQMPSDGFLPSTTPAGGHSHTVRIQEFQGLTAPSSTGSGSSTNTGSHTHTFTINTSTGLTSSLNRSIPPNPINIQPRTMYVRYFIRYA